MTPLPSRMGRKDDTRRGACSYRGEAGPLEGRIEGVGEGRSGIISRVEHVERVEG